MFLFYYWSNDPPLKFSIEGLERRSSRLKLAPHTQCEPAVAEIGALQACHRRRAPALQDPEPQQAAQATAQSVSRE